MLCIFNWLSYGNVSGKGRKKEIYGGLNFSKIDDNVTIGDRTFYTFKQKTLKERNVEM